MKARPFLLIAFVVLAACQTYDFQPVEPLAATQHGAEYTMMATQPPPNIMILLDKSDSMNDLIAGRHGLNVNGSPNPHCVPDNCNRGLQRCGPLCSTRINELRYAMEEFLEESLEMSPEDPRPLGKFGLTLFPIDRHSCAASEKVDIEFPPNDNDTVLRAKIKQIQEHIVERLYNSPENGRPITGGTPTGDSLRFLLDKVPALKDRDRQNFILLLTDGLPNCNLRIQQGGCPNANECICTLGVDAGVCKTYAGCAAQLDRQNFNGAGCLDNHATVEIIRELNTHGIKTIVVGFGVDRLGDVDIDDVLNAMASAGGFGEGKYYPADNREELLEALRKISEWIMPEPCFFRLSGQVTDPSLISVYINGERILPGNNTYYYDAERNAIVFVEDEALCESLKHSSTRNPVSVQITVLQTL